MKTSALVPLWFALLVSPIATHADLDAVIDGAVGGAIEQTQRKDGRSDGYRRHDRDDHDYRGKKDQRRKDHPVGHPDYHCPPGQAKKGRC